MVGYFFNVLTDIVCEYFMQDFSIYAHERHWSTVFFLNTTFSRFWYQCYTHLTKNLEFFLLFCAQKTAELSLGFLRTPAGLRVLSFVYVCGGGWAGASHYCFHGNRSV